MQEFTVKLNKWIKKVTVMIFYKSHTLFVTWFYFNNMQTNLYFPYSNWIQNGCFVLHFLYPQPTAATRIPKFAPRPKCWLGFQFSIFWKRSVIGPNYGSIYLGFKFILKFGPFLQKPYGTSAGLPSFLRQRLAVYMIVLKYW